MNHEALQQLPGLVLPALAVYAAIRADVSYLLREQRRTNARLDQLEKGGNHGKETAHAGA